MAKVWIERAYIEPHDPNEDNFSITIHLDNIMVGRVGLDNPKAWLYTINNEDGDLVINHSAGMEAKKWDHITKEIIGDISE